MSIADRYRHTLVVKKLVDAVDAGGAPILDRMHQPTQTASTVATVAGLVQPRSAREVAALSQAGPVVSDHVGYCDPNALIDAHCWVEVSGVRYDVLSVADAGGIGHHYELALRRVS